MPKPNRQNLLVRTPYHASRAAPIALDAATGLPASLDEASRSVEVIASTEEPAWVMDWDSWRPVREVLLMSGCRLPPSGRAVLLDTHSRDSVAQVLGSFRGARVTESEHGPALIGRTHYSSVGEADEAYVKVKEGHLTDVSVGYEVLAYIDIKEGESIAHQGNSYTGPLRLATDWALHELSVCPIGADDRAKVRHAISTAPVKRGRNKEKIMPKDNKAGKSAAGNKRGLLARLRAVLTALGLRAESDPEDAERQDIELVDAEGNPIAPADLSEEELVQLVENLEEVLTEAEDELATQDEQTEEDPHPAGRKAGRAARIVIAGRAPAAGQAGQAAPSAQVERARILAIRNLAQAHNLPPELEEQFINDGVSLTRAKAKVLDLRNAAPAGPGFHVATGLAEKDKYRAAAQDSLALRCGLKIEKPAAGAAELQSLSLRELARDMLVRSGERIQGHVGQMVARALASTDLPQLLVEASRRVLMEAFEAAPETWRGWAGTGIATDFKKSTAVGLEGDVRPLLKPEGGEYKEGLLAENAEEYAIRTFGRKMMITREAIINDDLNALTALPRMYGEATAEMVGDVAYAALLGSPNLMGDGNALFHVDHRNLYAGKGGIPTVENLGALVTGMKLQRDRFGKTITVVPKFYLAPVALEVASEQFFNTQLQGGPVVGTGDKPLLNNPYGGNYFTRIYDRRLDAVDASAYYLAAQRGTVVVFFLGGVEAPYIEEQIDFNTDGVSSKVRMDVGAKAMRWVTLAKATA